MKLWKRNSILIAVVLILSATIVKISGSVASVYRKAESWAIIEKDVAGKDADVFFIAPTVFLGSENELAWTDFDDATKAAFVGAIKMEKGIYDDNARFFAPFYHQAALSAYSAAPEVSDKIFDTAFEDIKDAFSYYLRNHNKKRPLIIAGFSQGAQLSLRLLECYEGSSYLKDVLVACYAIGWRFTEEEKALHPGLKFAEGENDTGVVVMFNSEAENVEDSLMIPAGTKTIAINPLNWKTDGTVALASENLGACFTNYDGEIEREIPCLTGAYIKDGRGSLVVTDVKPADYPAMLFAEGIYHIYDYQFFYRNLEKNVQDRISAFLSSK